MIQDKPKGDIRAPDNDFYEGNPAVANGFPYAVLVTNYVFYVRTVLFQPPNVWQVAVLYE